MLTRSQRKVRDNLLETNYNRAKEARDKSEIEKHNKDFKSLMSYAMSKIPADKRKEVENSLTPESKMHYTKITDEIKKVMTKPENTGTDIGDVAKFGNLKLQTFRDTYASKPLK